MTQQIDHNPREPKIDRSNTVFWVAWAIIAAAWLGFWYGGYAVDWVSVAAGGATMAVLVITVIEKTGNKSPW